MGSLGLIFHILIILLFRHDTSLLLPIVLKKIKSEICRLTVVRFVQWGAFGESSKTRMFFLLARSNVRVCVSTLLMERQKELMSQRVEGFFDIFGFVLMTFPQELRGHGRKSCCGGC